ncbi:MAG: FtsW/RodA/SpoVE family cell cycle protein, partial [Eubacteriales bacterium]|nr:FtsW/RodA/SpoVE family cell cycle protein [Eubacteriales bacterium]
LIFAFVYILMIFIATGKKFYFLSGVGGTALAFIGGYHLFNHVRVRVSIWKDPFQDFLGGGYQIALGMFAMANASWFGVGLGNGYGAEIPLVAMDMMIIPIMEEFGMIFSFLLILVCISCFVMFLNISSALHDGFYKLIAIGLGSAYILQVFLTVGGSTKFIPMTGVTLPLISYGGSSILSTIICFSIIQGLYVLRKEKPQRRRPVEKLNRRRQAADKRRVHG